MNRRKAGAGEERVERKANRQRGAGGGAEQGALGREDDSSKDPSGCGGGALGTEERGGVPYLQKPL